jgi:hypothetical protein
MKNIFNMYNIIHKIMYTVSGHIRSNGAVCRYFNSSSLQVPARSVEDILNVFGNLFFKTGNHSLRTLGTCLATYIQNYQNSKHFIVSKARGKTVIFV